VAGELAGRAAGIAALREDGLAVLRGWRWPIVS
jgi:hypothetical protein